LQYSPGERTFRKTAQEAIKFLRHYGQDIMNERISMIRRGDSAPADILTHIIKCKGLRLFVKSQSFSKMI